MRLRVLFHDHCFDGAASAAVFTRFFRERVDAGASVEYVGLAHKPGNAFPDDAFTGDVNAVVDFRYSRSPRLDWWIDHHQSAFEAPADEAHFRETRGDDGLAQKFWDPAAKSCTRFLARLLAERRGFDVGPQKELVEWAEIIDGALFPDPRTAVELTAPAMRLMLLLEATRDPALIPRIIAALSTRTLSEVIAEPYVQEPLGPLYERHLGVVKAVGERARCERAVATYDLADLGIDSVNKFIAYHLFAECRYTVSVTLGASRAKVSLGSNPWTPGERRHNLAALAEKYGGGGHPAVAAISFPRDGLEDARRAAADIAAQLRS